MKTKPIKLDEMKVTIIGTTPLVFTELPDDKSWDPKDYVMVKFSEMVKIYRGMKE